MKRFFKILFFVLLFHCAAFDARAQLFKAFVIGGVNIAQIDGDEVYGYKKVAPQLGAGVMVPLNPRTPYKGWQASLELLYSQKGARETLDPFAYKSSLHYVDIPLMIHYIDPYGGLTFGLGLQYGRLFKIKEDWGLPEKIINGFERPMVNGVPAFNKNDLSFVADVRFTVWKNFKLNFRYQYSLLPIREEVWYYNGYPAGTQEFKSWSRDFRNNYMSLRVIYVINERDSRQLDRNINRTTY